MRPKQWLFENGHIASPNQRGRMSLAHKQLIEDAVSKGAKIDGFSLVKSKGEDSKVEKVSVSTDRIADVPDEHRAEEMWEAHTSEGTVGMRTVCNNCTSSLTYCHCQHPRVWVDFDREGVVFFKPRKKPLPNKKW